MTDPGNSIIHVVDDDDAFRRSLVFLLESVGYEVVPHASASGFLEHAPASINAAGCAVLDIRMPVMSGLDLQLALKARGLQLPTVFVTGHGDVELAVQAMKNGACDFLEKPFRDQALLDAVATAVRYGVQERTRLGDRSRAEAQLAALSARERQVAQLVARGLPNKLVARALEISDKTVQVHRHHVMEKTGTGSAAELARLFMRANPAALD